MIVKELYFVLNIIKYFVRHFDNPESEILKIISDSFVRKFFFLIIPQYYFPSPCYLTEQVPKITFIPLCFNICNISVHATLNFTLKFSPVTSWLVKQVETNG